MGFRLVYKGVGLLLSFSKLFVKPPFQRYISALWRHPDITRHFLVKGRTEDSTIEGKYTDLLRIPKKRAGLARKDQQCSISRSLAGKAVRHIPDVFHIRNV